MADIADLAGEQEELERRAALSHRKPEGPAATGFCLNCGETVEAPRRWCDKDCRDDWQRDRAR